MLKLGIALTFVAGLVFAGSAAHKTKVQLWFDAEDYTWAKSDDAIRDIAKLLTEEGVRGHFNTVGYLAAKLVERRRFDVIDALKPHLVGVAAPVRVKATDLRAAAAKVSFKRHLPVSYDVGGMKLGPADFLFAALEVLETGADEVTVTPRDQLGDVRAFSPSLADFTHVGAWMYVPEFKDHYLSDRLRWQFWTLRFE